MSNNARPRSILPGFVLCALGIALASEVHAAGGDNGDPIVGSVQQMLAIDTELALKKELQLELEARGLKAGAQPQPLISPPTAAPIMTPMIQPVVADAVPAPASPQPQASKQPPKPVLILDGIFGKGGQLFADVVIDGQKVRYKRDQRMPLGYDSSFGYQLVSINVPCVQLKSAVGQHRVCIDGRGDSL